MIRRLGSLAVSFFILCLSLHVGGTSALAASLDPSLGSKISGLGDTAEVGTVIVSFKTTSGLAPAHLDALRGAGVLNALTLQNLGMVAFPATAGQVRALASNPAVRSVWANSQLTTFNLESRTLTGVDRVRTDTAFTRANGGLPVDGHGDFSVVINDSGIDATHSDLKLGDHVIQNVHCVADTDTLSGFTPLVTIENVPNTDSVGHGTHCAGIVGGSGQMSGGKYAGVAPGAKLIGVGSGAVLFVLNALGGFEYSLANQSRYHIRVISNSFGGSGAFDPDSPINIATKTCYDRNISVVFAAGNSGPGKNTHNPYAKAPWVISVAAGTKEGGLASFSSRGTPKETRLANADPNDDFDAPTITAPGTGREFDSNSGKFTAAIVSTRAITNIFTNGLTDDAELAPAEIPFYTQISGTSMATPFISGTIALMLDVDPTLTPDEIKSILTSTATPMPGYADFEVGAGYVNVYAAVDKVSNRAKSYGSYLNPTFNARYTTSGPAPVPFHIDYNPAGLPGPGSINSTTFTVDPGMSSLDVQATIDTALEDGEGNTVGLLLTDPNGTKYSAGIALPILDAPSREVVVSNPVAGQWLLEVRGVRGLAAAPNVSLPTSGAAAPGPVDGTIEQVRYDLPAIADIQGHPLQADIETAIKSRMIDVGVTGNFLPDAVVSRGNFARTLALNVPLRQTLAASPRFVDVSASFEPIAEAIAANGSTLRDYTFTPTGLLATPTATTFNPTGSITRLDLAVALVKALGHDADAKALANTMVTSGGVPLTDGASIPPALRGYVQIALNLGILEAFPAEVRALPGGAWQALPGPRFEPTTTVTRGVLASKLVKFSAAFRTGA